MLEEFDKIMAKKKKSNAIQANNEFTTLEVDAELKPVDSQSQEKSIEPTSETNIEDAELDELLGEKSKNEVVENANSSKFLSRLTPEMTEKLEKIDSLEKHCLELEQENAKLSDSINLYLEEIETLKSKKSIDAPIDGEMSLVDLKHELDKARSEIAEMRKSLKELREENDNYLMKISELTFENAKLTSQLQEIEKNMAMVATPTHDGPSRKSMIQPSTAVMRNQPQFANPYLQNGYQDW